MKEKRVISAKVTKTLYLKMEASKDLYFEEQQKFDPEIRNSWKGFFVMLYRHWLKDFLDGDEGKESLFFNLGKGENK